MKYTFLIDDFEGPLDLLLSLIKKSDLNICDIKIEDITNQYLDYISEMENLNLNVSSEYLVIAAELIEMKSLELLPSKEEIYEDEVNPREELINKLLLYKQFKEVSSKLKELEEERRLSYSKIASDLSEFKDETEKEVEHLELNMLAEAFKRFLERKEDEKPLSTTITKKEYSVSERSFQIKKILEKKGEVKFEELFDIYSRDYIVVTFLSVLDLVRKQMINIKQENNFAPITLMLKKVSKKGVIL